MSDPTPVPSQFEADHYPLRGGDWLARGAQSWIEIAQVKSVYRDGNEFLVDLILYDHDGNKLGRVSPKVEPLIVAGRRFYGPRTFEPACSLEDWRRIKKPDFPIELMQVWEPDPNDAEKMIGTFQYIVERRPWGSYARRKRSIVPAPMLPARSNYDPELDRRARKLAAEMIRDFAREHGVPELKQKAEELERDS